MGVNRGEQWGEIGLVPDTAIVVGSDRALAALLLDRTFKAGQPVVLTGGDLCATLGGRGRARPGSEATLVDVDVGEVLLDGHLHRFVAHLVTRPTRHPGRWWVAANAAHRGSWNLAPRAHPGDGLLDILDTAIPGGELMAAWRRLKSGTHVPHPAIRQERTGAVQMGFDRPTTVLLDGQSVGKFRNLSVRVKQGALRIAV